MIKTCREVYGARTRPDLVNKFHAQLNRQGLNPTHKEDSSPLAYVNHNRWIIDCPTCGSGIAVSPRDPGIPAMCFECGETRRVTYPPDWKEAERILIERPWRSRHWIPLNETLDDLRGENTILGVPVPPQALLGKKDK